MRKIFFFILGFKISCWMISPCLSLLFFASYRYKNQASFMGNFKILPPLAPRTLPSARAALGARKAPRARFLISSKQVY